MSDLPTSLPPAGGYPDAKQREAARKSDASLDEAAAARIIHRRTHAKTLSSNLASIMSSPVAELSPAATNRSIDDSTSRAPLMEPNSQIGNRVKTRPVLQVQHIK